jgi:hypothetical protein
MILGRASPRVAKLLLILNVASAIQLSDLFADHRLLADVRELVTLDRSEIESVQKNVGMRVKSIRTDLCSAAVVFSFLKTLPANWCKSALEEGVVYDVLLVIFAFDDPVTGMNLTPSQIGNDQGRLCALGRFYQQRSLRAIGIH